MKRASTIFLQIVIVLMGLGVLTLMLRMPLFEGRNVNATLFQVYFNDPFLAYVYTASIAFYAALFQAYKLLGCTRQNQIFSQAAVKSLMTIKYCAIALAGFILGAEAYFFITLFGKDDIAGGVMVGIILIFISIVVATAAAIFERTLQCAVDIKSENDLTI